MTTYLLDANVVVSLLNAKSPHFTAARRWFKAEGSQSWCTSPIVQNGAIRILRNPAVSHQAVTFLQVAESVSSLLAIGNHQFIPDTISLLDEHLFDHHINLTPKQSTDAYLLALAVHHGLTFATLDRNVAHQAVRNGGEHLLVLM